MGLASLCAQRGAVTSSAPPSPQDEDERHWAGGCTAQQVSTEGPCGLASESAAWATIPTPTPFHILASWYPLLP